ncbi:MAG: 16S rRNA (cytosine(1402)-N(4))-methyltransferase RsmH [Patescibacteria group bacterium]
MEIHLIHIPVLVEEAIALMDLRPGEAVVDATVGGGGHATKILPQISPGGFFLGLDRDSEAVESAYEKLSSQKSKVELVVIPGNYNDLGDLIKEHGHKRVDAILFDLGLSSRQLSGRRGFSFKEDAPLDMRFDANQELTAAEIVNSYPKEELARIIWEFGEERASRKIADAIFTARRREKITSTGELADIVATAKGGRHGRIHPATQTFQALRIAVNDELGLLTTALPRAIACLNQGGRLAVISYHSLEDRIVKNVFRDQARAELVKLITKKPVVPTPDEIHSNPRARSAKLRVIEKI